jgi:hypothetical protein
MVANINVIILKSSIIPFQNAVDDLNPSYGSKVMRV